MIEKVAVGTDGSETANKAVDFAFDVAEKFGATVVICSSYRPVSEDKVRRDQREAPEDIQWSINPTQEVDSTLTKAAERAQGRGMQTVTEAREGDPADVLVRHRRGARRRPAGGRQQGHAAPRARQRPEQRLAQGALLGGDRQDDVTCRRDVRHGRPAEGLLRGPQPARHRRHDGRARRATRSGSSTRTCRRPAATAAATRSAHFLEQFLDSWDDFEQQIEEVHAEDDCVLLFIRLTASGQGQRHRRRVALRAPVGDARGPRRARRRLLRPRLGASRAARGARRLTRPAPRAAPWRRTRRTAPLSPVVEVLAEDRRREQLERAERRVGVGRAAEALDPVVDARRRRPRRRSRSGTRPRRARSAA